MSCNAIIAIVAIACVALGYIVGASYTTKRAVEVMKRRK